MLLWIATPCYLKTINKSAKFETFKPLRFLFRTGMRKDFHQKANFESRCVIGPENIPFLGVRAAFSPDILQAGAVKGLRILNFALLSVVFK